MKKGKWIFLAAVVILAGIGIWWWQSSSSEGQGGGIVEDLVPEMEVISTKVSNITGDSINATSEIQLKNPFPVELSTQRIDYEIFIDSIKVIEDAYDKPVKIASSDSTVIKIPVVILADPMEKVFHYFEKHQVDSAQYTLNINFQVDVPIAGETDFSLGIDKTLPAFRLIEVELENMDLNILSGDEGVDVIVNITNPNLFPMSMQDATFYFILGDELEISGELQDYINLPAGGTAEVKIDAREERGSLTQTALSYLFDQEGTGFSYYFRFLMDSENAMLNDTEMELKVVGTLADISEVL